MVSKQTPREGSMLEKRVAVDLQKERDNINFNTKDMRLFLYRF
jgi:hypothetical protein